MRRPGVPACTLAIGAGAVGLFAVARAVLPARLEFGDHHGFSVGLFGSAALTLLGVAWCGALAGSPRVRDIVARGSWRHALAAALTAPGRALTPPLGALAVAGLVAGLAVQAPLQPRVRPTPTPTPSPTTPSPHSSAPAVVATPTVQATQVAPSSSATTGKASSTPTRTYSPEPTPAPTHSATPSPTHSHTAPIHTPTLPTPGTEKTPGGDQ